MVPRAIINPAMMTWAREYAGFTEEYEELLPGYIKKHYESWEKGDKYPTWNQLRDVSKKFNVPTAFFFMKTIPEFDDFPKLVNFRKLDNNAYSKESPNLIKEIRKSENRRENYLDLLFELDKDVPKFEVIGKSLSKYDFVNYIREKLDVSLDNQKSWIRKNNSLDKNHYNFLNNWKEIITEKMGVLIFETDGVILDEMRGLCIFHEEMPIILLNGKDSTNGRIFSLFHELTHLLIGESAICENNELSKEEIFCNAVAGEFLVPRDDLNNNVHDLSEDSINDLAHLYGVSSHVILRRLYDTDIINHHDYNFRIDNLKDFSESNSTGPGGSYFNNIIKYNSEPFCAVVLEAYENGIISTGEFSKFTNLKKKFIPDLQKRIYGDEQ
ncbi:ImmA/IrrE family metallo-endopeptidase [Methanobrevibacter sp.]